MAKKKARRSQVIPEDESKSARFVRVVTPRIGKAVKAIKVIGYCSGATYEYTEKQVTEITDALTAAITNLRGQFSKDAAAESEFSFKQ